MASMTIKLSGGPRDGEVLQVPDSMRVLSAPRISLRDAEAALIMDGDTKRHSWDDDALCISYLEYERTEMESDDGAVIFMPRQH